MSRARNEGGGGGVVMVAQRGGTKKEATSRSSAKQRGGDNKLVDQDKKRMSVAGGMWDSFESESASEDDGESDDIIDDDDAKDRRSRQRGSTNSNNNSNSSSGSLASRHSNRRRGSSSHHHHNSSDRTKHGDRRNSSSSKRSKGKLVSDRDSDKKTMGSLGSGGKDRHSHSGSGGSDARSSSKRRNFSKGDSVVVYLSSGEKAKGTISRESSTTRGRYDVKLEKGGAQRHVDSRDISPARRRRRGLSGTSERISVRDQSSVRGRGTSSRNSGGSRSSSSDRRSSDSRSHSNPQQRRRSSSEGVKSKSLPPASDLAEAVDDNNQPSGGPVSPPSSDALAATTTPTSGGGGALKEGSQAIDSVAGPGGKDASSRSDAGGSEAGDGDDGDGGDGGDDDTGDSAGKAPRPERSSSPITRKVRQAQGLLKTMFLKKGEERNGGEHRRSSSATRRWPRIDSLSRRFSTDSSDHRGMDSASAASSCDDVDREQLKSPNTKQTTAVQDCRASTPGDGDGDGEGDGGDRSVDDAARGRGGANEDATTKTVGGRARRLSRGLMRGRSRNRKEEMLNRNGASPSPASRSPSIVNKLGVTIRGAVMGSTRLGVHQPHVDQASAAASPAGSGGSDGDNTQGTYSTGASTQRRQQRRRRRSAGGLKRHDDASKGRNEEVVTYSSDGFDDDMLSQNSPVAPTTYAGDPRNLPDAVSSYIGAREKIEHETSASGPVFLPRSDNLAQGSGDGMLGRGKRRGSLDITKGAASTTQRSEQNQPFTEAMFKAGVSETRHSTKQGILLEGDLQKFSPESMRGVRWHKRYFVLYASSCELRYYRTHAEAAWGRIPLGERGSIPLRLVVKIEQPSDKKYRGCRFDLVVLHKGDGRHPGLHIRPGHESRVVTTKTFKFNAADAQQRLLWVTVIEALMKKHGWGLDADRRRNMRAPRHGGPSAAASDSLWGAWGGEAETEVSGEHSRQEVGRSSMRGSHKAGSFEDLPAAPNTSDLRCDTNGRVQPHPASRKNSVMTFVEEGDHHMRPINSPQNYGNLPQRDEASLSLGRTESGRQRGIRIPYSPQGRRGSLTTEALSPPVPACGGARRQTSLKSDLRPMKFAEMM